MKTATEPPKRLQEKQSAPPVSTMLQVRLSAKSDQNLKKMVDTTGISNRTHLVNAAIDLAADVLDTIHKGGTVIYEQADGTKVRLKIVGM